MSLKEPSLVALALGELDELILKTLSEAKITFYDETIKVINPETAIESFKEEMASRHILTIINVSLFCIRPLGNIYLNAQPENPTEEYKFLFLATAGWAKGIPAGTENADAKMRTESPYCPALNELFSSETIEAIQNALPQLIKDFFNAVEVCTADVNRDRSVEDSQINLLKDFAEAFIKAPAGKEKEASEIAKKIDKSEMMKYYWKTQSEGLFGTPCEKLMTTFQKLLLYWDLLHHAGWLNMSQSEDPYEMEWYKLF